MFAVIKTKGYQYLVKKGEKITIPASIGNPGTKVEFDEVMMIKDNSDTKVGSPYIKGAKVKGIVKQCGKLPKITVFKFRRREKYRRKKGHRQHFTEVEITDIVTK
jgi:large subunit ribosomal protein L21